MLQQILSAIPSVAIAVASVAMCITAFINYLSCDSCKAKRESKLAKLSLKILELKEKDKNGN